MASSQPSHQAGDSPSNPNTVPTGQPAGSNAGRKRRAAELEESEDGLTSAPRKKYTTSDPLVRQGRHFGRTVQTFCRMGTVIRNGMERVVDLEVGKKKWEELGPREQREHSVYLELLKTVPGIEERICLGTDEQIQFIADLMTKGINSARAEDTKSLKSAIVDWIVPKGQALIPPISRNIKSDRGFYHYWTGKLLCPASLDWDDPQIQEALRSGTCYCAPNEYWPKFLFEDYEYDGTWKGLFRSRILVLAYKHIFTSPSSVESECRATRSGNAELNNMTSVTIPSLAYVATQVRFALSSSSVFTSRDHLTNSESFYNSIITFLNDPEEKEDVDKLLNWWNTQIFPSSHPNMRTDIATMIANTPSVVSQLKANRRKALGEKDQNIQQNNSSGGSAGQTSNPATPRINTQSQNQDQNQAPPTS